MVQAARKQLLLSDKNYREILRVCAGVQSSTELGQEGLEAVLAFFESLGWTNTSPKHHRLGLRPGMASDAQLARLRRLAASYFTGGDAARSASGWSASARRTLDSSARKARRRR